MSQGRFFRQKPKELLGTKWDSTLEKHLFERLQGITESLTEESGLSRGSSRTGSSLTNGSTVQHHWQFKGSKIKYQIQKEYNPDFVISKKQSDTSTGSSKVTIYVEAKGYFQDATEAAKYIWVREVLGPHEELVFLFENPKTTLHYLKKRKDGTKMTMQEWAEKNGFRWFTLENIEEVFH